jgi:hypothetical protein
MGFRRYRALPVIRTSRCLRTQRGSLCFRRRLSQMGSLSRRIDSTDKARQVPHLAYVALKQVACLPHRSLIVTAIDNARRARNTPVLTKFIDTINCHGAPKAQQAKIGRARGRSRERPRRKTLLPWRVPRLSYVIIYKHLRQMSGEDRKCSLPDSSLTSADVSELQIQTSLLTTSIERRQF